MIVPHDKCFSSVINVVSCTYGVSYDKVVFTCGSCVAGYYGGERELNIKCQIKNTNNEIDTSLNTSDVRSGGDSVGCQRYSDYLYGSYVGNTCATLNQIYPSNTVGVLGTVCVDSMIHWID